MSAPYYGDLPQDPQDAARDAALSAGDAADYFDRGTPLPAPAATADKSLYDTLTLFCSRDETRYVLQKPFNQDGYTWASDGRNMVRVPQLTEVENNIELNYPNVTAVWKYNTEFPRGPLEDLPELPDDAGKPTECKECSGTGIDTCHCCGSELDCDNCDGGWLTDPRWMRIGEHRHRLIQLAQIKSIGAKFSQIQIPENYLYFTNGTIEGVMSSILPSVEMLADNEWKGDPS